MKSLKCAFGLLTRFPVPGKVDLACQSQSVVWYFLPALCTGVLSAAFFVLTAHLRVAYFAALCFFLVELLATGALHVDGFADVCDAFFAPAAPERKVEILHDSRLGTFGVLGIAFDVGARVLLAGDLNPGLDTFLLLSAVPAAGKISLIACLIFSKAADGSLMGAGLIGKVSPRQSAGSLVLLAGVVLLLAKLRLGAAVAGAGVLVGVLMARTAKKNIGGCNGDVLGAANELGEIACLIIAAGWLG